MVYGDLGKRVFAYIIDSIVITIITLLLLWILYITDLLFFVWWIAAIVPMLYYVLMEGGEWHATLGKKMMGLYVGNSGGDGIPYSTAVLRYLCKILSAAVFGIGFIMGFFNPEKQCLHDMIAKTYVLEGSGVRASGSKDGRPQVICVSGALAGTTYDIPSGGIMIGRDRSSCRIVLPPTQNCVSRIHCLVTYNKNSGMFILSDKNSTHGTYLANGTRVAYGNPVALYRGNRFYVATRENTFEVR